MYHIKYWMILTSILVYGYVRIDESSILHTNICMIFAVSICTHTHTLTYIQLYTQTHVTVHPLTYLAVSIHSPSSLHTETLTHAKTHTHTHTHTHAHTHTHKVFDSRHTHPHTKRCKHPPPPFPLHTHTCMHAQTHIQTCMHTWYLTKLIPVSLLKESFLSLELTSLVAVITILLILVATPSSFSRSPPDWNTHHSLPVNHSNSFSLEVYMQSECVLLLGNVRFSLFATVNRNLHTVFVCSLWLWVFRYSSPSLLLR